MRRALVKRALVSLILIGFAFSACARGPEVRFIAREDLPTDLYGAGPGEPNEPRNVSTVIYFARTSAEGVPFRPARLGAISRKGNTSQPLAAFAMSQLLEGPTANETKSLRTAMATGTELLSVSVRDGVADVNLTGQFESAAAELVQLLRVAQVVWTLTELPNIEFVRFRIHGAPQPVIDQLGVARELVSRARYSRLAPQDADAPDAAPDSVASPTPTGGP